MGCVGEGRDGSAQGHNPHQGVYTVGQCVDSGFSGLGLMPDDTLLPIFILLSKMENTSKCGGK